LKEGGGVNDRGGVTGEKRLKKVGVREGWGCEPLKAKWGGGATKKSPERGEGGGEAPKRRKDAVRTYGK